MTAFLDIDLKQVAHVIERWRGLAEMALLFDRRWLGVTLHHDKTAQHGAILAGYFLPRLLAQMLTEIHLACLVLRR